MQRPLQRYRTAVYGLFAVNYIIILYFWWKNSFVLLDLGGYNTLLAIGRLEGLTAAYLIIWQFLMLSRARWIEAAFGFDRVTRVHRYNGLLAFFFLVSHPFLVTLSYARGESFLDTMSTILDQFDGALLALAGWLLFHVTILISFTIVRKRLKYEWWYAIHIFNYAALGLVYVHQRNLGGTLLGSPGFLAYWTGLYLLAMAHVAYFRVARPVTRYFRHRFRVEQVVAETPSVTSITITGRNLGSFRVKPGQFSIWRFLDPDYALQAHPFSISNTPDGKTLRISARRVGDFTRSLPNIRPGTAVMVDGPYGIFTSEVMTKSKILMIAGGIGITPIWSLAGQLAPQGFDIALLYANRTASDVPLKDELDELAQLYRNFRIRYMLADESAPGYERGMLDAASITRAVPDAAQRDIYLCGPPAMMRSVRQGLLRAGVRSAQIHYEQFSL